MVLKAINPEAFANIMPRYSGNFTINKSWLFDGFAWANISSMIVKRAKAACTAAFSEQFNVSIKILFSRSLFYCDFLLPFVYLSAFKVSINSIYWPNF
jgi:hypothetical protein